MKCLLQNDRQYCRLTGSTCEAPVELGDEAECPTYEEKFPPWFERQVVKIAPDMLTYFYHEGFEREVPRNLEEVEGMMDHLVEDVYQRLHEQDLSKHFSVIPPNQTIEQIIHDRWSTIVLKIRFLEELNPVVKTTD